MNVRVTWAPLIGAGIGLAVATAAGLVSLRAGVPGVAIAQTEIVGLAYLAAGAIAWRRRPNNRTGPLLLAIGYAWYVPDFQASSVPAVAASAFATRRLVNALSAYLMLTFPSGRLGLRRHRLAMGLVIALPAIQIPTRLLLVDRIPAVLEHVDRVTTLGCDCVNPFALASAPAVFAAVERWTGFLTVVAAVLIMALVILRLTDATPPMRRVLWPVLFGAIVGLVIFAFNVLSFTLKLNAPLTGALGWVLSAARASVPMGFLVGLLRMRMGKAAVATLVVGLRDERRRDSLERSTLSYPFVASSLGVVISKGETIELARSEGPSAPRTFVRKGRRAVKNSARLVMHAGIDQVLWKRIPSPAISARFGVRGAVAPP